MRFPGSEASSSTAGSDAPAAGPLAWLVAVDPEDAVLDGPLAYRPAPGWEERPVPVGARVQVPLQRRLVRGWVLQGGPAPSRSLKSVVSVDDPATWLPPERVQLAAWVAGAYLCPPGQALASVAGPVPAPAAQRTARAGRGGARTGACPQGPSPGPPPPVPAAASMPELTPPQRAALAAIGEALQAGEFRGILLWGVTGSGKTRVYQEAARLCVLRGRHAVILVPEIALTPQLVREFRRWPGGRVVLLHSQMSLSERRRQWQELQSGQPVVLIGPRSAALAAPEGVGLFVVDEEHETSYKQEEAPRYHAREVVLQRARWNGAVVVLGSATPSLESYYQACLGQLQRVELPQRVEGQSPAPQAEVVDLRQELAETGRAGPLSRALVERLREVVARRRQAILFVNRRGFAGAIQCRECGFAWRCPHCDVNLTYHHGAPGVLRCHYCDHQEPLARRCPRCTGQELAPVGFGTQRLQAALQAAFPGLPVFRLDADTMARRHAHERVLEEFGRTFPAVLVGTQMVAKGHHFPRVTLAAAVLADVSLTLPDFRAAERTFQLLVQLAGRAGRGQEPGRVLVQTYRPDHYSIRCALAEDLEGFYHRELEFRQRSGYPPFTGLVRLVAADPDEERARRAATELVRRLTEHAGSGQACRVLGPAPAPLRKLQDRFRWQALVKGPEGMARDLVAAVLAGAPLRGAARPQALVVDVDPLSML